MKKLLLLFVIFVIVGCSAPDSGNNDVIESGFYYDFHYQVIDGMPCLVAGDYEAVAISCDWSQWDGMVVNGEIVIQK